jgi:predicted RNA binding protein YcfA (HicA-like mRNA interferase family)
MKLSRNESGPSLIKKLSKLGYVVSRQKGSHIRMSRITSQNEHHITIPNHNPIKIGLLAKILASVALALDITKEDLLDKLKE